MSACDCGKLSSVVEKLASFESLYDDTVLPPAYGHGYEKCIMYQQEIQPRSQALSLEERAWDRGYKKFITQLLVHTSPVILHSYNSAIQ